MSKAILHIMPFEEEGKTLVLFSDHQNYLKVLAGDDSALLTAFWLNKSLSTIENIVVELDDGVPVRVHVV